MTIRNIAIADFKILVAFYGMMFALYFFNIILNRSFRNSKQRMATNDPTAFDIDDAQGDQDDYDLFPQSEKCAECDDHLSKHDTVGSSQSVELNKRVDSKPFENPPPAGLSDLPQIHDSNQSLPTGEIQPAVAPFDGNCEDFSFPSVDMAFKLTGSTWPDGPIEYPNIDPVAINEHTGLVGCNYNIQPFQ